MPLKQLIRHHFYFYFHFRRLRRAVLHPSLVQAKEGSEDSLGDVNVDSLITRYSDGTSDNRERSSCTFAEGVLSRLQEAVGQECAVCFDLMDLPVLVPNCMHSWWVKRTFMIYRVIESINSCKSCALAFLQSCEEKGEDGHCPICRSGPVKVGSFH